MTNQVDQFLAKQLIELGLFWFYQPNSMANQLEQTFGFLLMLIRAFNSVKQIKNAFVSTCKEDKNFAEKRPPTWCIETSETSQTQINEASNYL